MPLYCIPTPDMNGADHIGVFYPNFYRLEIEDKNGKRTWLINAENAHDALMRMECVVTPESMEDERTANFLLDLSRDTGKIWLPSDYDDKFLCRAARMAGYSDMSITAISMKDIPDMGRASFMLAKPMAQGAMVCALLPSIRNFFAAARDKGVSPICAGQENAAYREHLQRHIISVAEEQMAMEHSLSPPSNITLH
jgi:hypothetical protein